MNSFLEIFGISIIIILSAYFARLLYINQNGKSMPGTKRKQQIFKKIWMWKNQGLSYDERLERLIKNGYHKSVANILLGEAEYNYKPANKKKATH